MTCFQDPTYLTRMAYAGADRLAARIRLHEQFTVTQTDLHRWLFDLMLAAAGGQARVLEVGTGRGDLWGKNAERIPPDWNVTLTDLSAGMLADNRAHLGELTARFSYTEADAQLLPFDDASFDLVVANYMLYHVPDLPRAVRELRRVLTPSGALAAATNGVNHMLEINQLVESVGLHDGATALGVMNVRLAFNLQNGAEALGAAFGDVQSLDYPNHLRVTDAEPLIDYVLSMLDSLDRESSEVDTLRQRIEAEIASHGYFHISKETGVFIARG